jgi:hypothetical protein
MTAEEPGGYAGPVLVLLMIGSGILYGLGYLTAVMRRANSDYKKTKTALPGMRKDFWVAWWNMVKIGFWVAIAALVLIAWAVHDVRATR